MHCKKSRDINYMCSLFLVILWFINLFWMQNYFKSTEKDFSKRMCYFFYILTSINIIKTWWIELTFTFFNVEEKCKCQKCLDWSFRYTTNVEVASLIFNLLCVFLHYIGYFRAWFLLWIFPWLHILIFNVIAPCNFEK